MNRKEKQLLKSKEWLEWLSDETDEDISRYESQPPNKKQAAKQQAPRKAGTIQARSIRSHESSAVHTPDTYEAQRLPTRLRAGSFYASSSESSVGSSTVDRSQHRNHKEPQVERVIMLRLPSWSLRKLLRQLWSKKRILQISIGAVCIVLLVVISPIVIRKHAQNAKQNQTSEDDSKPNFAPLVPTGLAEQDSSSANGTQQNVQYDATKQTYRYTDEYKGVSLVVSQQLLPDDLRENSAKLKSVAYSVGATEDIGVYNGTLYISPTDKATSQRLVYASKQLLIFISAPGVLRDADWVAYVQGLSSQ